MSGHIVYVKVRAHSCQKAHTRWLVRRQRSKASKSVVDVKVKLTGFVSASVPGSKVTSANWVGCFRFVGSMALILRRWLLDHWRILREMENPRSTNGSVSYMQRKCGKKGKTYEGSYQHVFMPYRIPSGALCNNCFKL
eukprot:6661516-Pyramimonas_sp.AAC.1